jgi:hypothetical protein
VDTIKTQLTKALGKGNGKGKGKGKGQPQAVQPQASQPSANLPASSGDHNPMIAKALAEGMTPETAAAILAERKARLSAAAKKAHETRKANGTASTSAKAAWQTRRQFNEWLKGMAERAS